MRRLLAAGRIMKRLDPRVTEVRLDVLHGGQVYTARRLIDAQTWSRMYPEVARMQRAYMLDVVFHDIAEAVPIP